MRPYRTFLFILSVFLILGIIGYLIPQDGIQVRSKTLNFPSPKSVLSAKQDTVIDIELNIEELKRQADLSQIREIEDSLIFFKEFTTNNKARLHFPNQDYTYLDTLFESLDSAKTSGQAVHILHYGDSQIEIDRISSNFRQTLQEQFSGQGSGIIPAIQTIPSFSVRQTYSGDLSRFAVYGDTTHRRASHRRYGLLANFSQLNGTARITAKAARVRQTQDSVKTFSRVILLIGNNTDNFTAKCNGLTRSIKQANKGVSALSWDFETPISNVSISLNGIAEIYGVSLEGKAGVVVDNVPMRGCSGTIFSQIDSTTLSQAYKAMNVQMIILQYGGNMMPQIDSERAISRYMKRIERQLKYLKNTNPQVKLMFIGPSDMGKRINGEMQTYPYLPALNDSLQQTVLRNGGVYWDMFQVMGGKNSMSAWVKHNPGWASTDYIHFTDAGAKKIATMLSDAFMVHYQFYRLRKTCNPALIKEFMTNTL